MSTPNDSWLKLKLSLLLQGVPGWVGNTSGHAPTYYCDDNIKYQIAWLKCLKESWGVESDYLGLWNERPQGSTDYVIELRHALDKAGFDKVGITVEATWEELVRKALTNSTFNASIVSGSAHYPCNATTNSEATVNASLKWWAGEDNTGGLGPNDTDLERTGNWTGASCWGRKLNQHFVKMRATSTVAWSLIWSAAPGVSSNGILGTAKTHGFLGNGFLNATEPHSGHYDVPPVLWVNAHWHQFAQPGWRFLKNSTSGGSGWLPSGGSYVTLVPPEGSAHPANTFTMIVETLVGTCGSRCNSKPIPETQNLSFVLKGPLASTHTVALWCSNESAVFMKQPQVTIMGGVLSLSMKPDTLCTATTLLSNGKKGQHPKPPPSGRFPKSYTDDFTNYTVDMLARGFSDVYGSFAVRPTSSATPKQMALTQVATAKPTGWAPTNLDPLTFIGDSMWTDVSIRVTAMINGTNSTDGTDGTNSTELSSMDPPQPPAQPPYVLICGGCGDTSRNGLSYGCPKGCCFQISEGGNWSIGASKLGRITGVIKGFTDTWHTIGVDIEGGAISATVDGVKLGSVPGSCVPPRPIVFPGHGMVGLGCGGYHYCQFSSFGLAAK
jgi:galactosylceramidase